jgi:hypothetical protein
MTLKESSRCSAQYWNTPCISRSYRAKCEAVQSPQSASGISEKLLKPISCSSRIDWLRYGRLWTVTVIRQLGRPRPK